MRIVCLSDTHLRPVAVPDGDVLVHAGDFTMGGTLPEVASFGKWLARLGHGRKVVVAGNHDFALERSPARARPLLGDVAYLEDALVEIGGLRFWGSPWQPRFGDWAFGLDRGAEIRARWDVIPGRVDVLVTHGPPGRIGDRLISGEHVGCADLRAVVAERRPRLHVFGHIHEGYGVVQEAGITYANASICDVAYQPVNAPLVFDL